MTCSPCADFGTGLRDRGTDGRDTDVDSDINVRIDAVWEAMNAGNREQLGQSCHDLSMFLKGKNEMHMFVCIENGLLQRLIILLEEEQDTEILIPLLMLLLAFVNMPSHSVTQFMMSHNDFPRRMSSFLTHDDARVVDTALLIVGLNAKHFVASGTKFFDVYKFPVAVLEGVLEKCVNGSEIGKSIKRRTLFTCKEICESQRSGRNMMAVMDLIMRAYEPWIDPEVVFPTVVRLMKNYWTVVIQDAVFDEFVTKRIVQFIALKSLPMAHVERVSYFAIKVFLCRARKTPEVAAKMCSMVAIDDLVELMEKSRQSKFVTKGIELLLFKCEQPGTNWIFKYLFDRHFEERLPCWLSQGPFRLKRAVLAMSGTVLCYASRENKLDALMSGELMNVCCDFLNDDDLQMSKRVLCFLSKVPPVVRSTDRNLHETLISSGVMNILDTMANENEDETLARKARCLIDDFRQIL